MSGLEETKHTVKYGYFDGNTASTLGSYWRTGLWQAFPCSSDCPGLIPGSGTAATWTPSLWPKTGSGAGTLKDHHYPLTKINMHNV